MVSIFSHYLKKQTSVASPIGNTDSKVQKVRTKVLNLLDSVLWYLFALHLVVKWQIPFKNKNW